MTIKQKFSSIDQSKLTADQKAFLTKIKTVTKNFTNEEMNKKVEAPLNGFIEKAKEKMPEAIKSSPVKRTASSKTSQTKKPKRTPMSLAKEIRKEGESWNDARARASKMMKEDSKDLSKTVETELDKLSKLVKDAKTRSKLVGIKGTDIKRDAVRRAKPRGARTVTHSGETSNQYGTFNNKLGRKYYESRDRHSDRLAPNYPKNAPLLAKGGAVTNERKHVNHNEDYEVRYARTRPSRNGYKGNRNFALGGTVVTDLAGHSGGEYGVSDSTAPLDGFTNTYYTNLVGETGALSSGEMFARGGGIPNNYEGKSADEVWNDFTNDQKYHFLSDHREKIGFEEDLYNESKRTTKPKKSSMGTNIGFMYIDSDKIINTKYTELPRYVKFALLDHVRTGQYARGGGVRKVGNREYSYGRNWTNDHKHVNKDENHEVKYNRKGKFLGVFNDGGMMNDGMNEVNYKRKRFMAGGMNDETPRIYVADLEAYNSGRLVGEWLDLADYNDADELMDAIQDVLKKSGGEEYAIHDAEYIPRNMYSEYMGQKDFEELYEMMDLAKDNDLPLEVVQEIVSQYSASAVEEFVGKYNSTEDFAMELIDEMGGIQSFNHFEFYLNVSDMDRRLISQEMADSYVDDIKNEDGGNRLIQEAGLDVNEYEAYGNQSKEEMIDLATSMVTDEYYDNFYEGLRDPFYFLVEEQGMYSAEDLANADFITVDYEKLANALEQDYTVIEYDGDVYVFNIR